MTNEKVHDTVGVNGVNGVNGTDGAGSQYRYSHQPLAKPRPIRIIVAGAGLSGIAAVKLFKERFNGQPTELQIYEKNADVGGTWLENRYPGCSCDVPAHAYTFSWEGNPRWSKAYVGAEELFDYFKGRAKAYGVFDFVQLEHRVIGATWNGKAGQWEIEVEDLKTGKTFVDKAEVFINACGFLNKWKWPEIPGLQSFKGHLAHSARWDDSYSFQGKTVAVIGCGSSAIQIVPKIQPIAKSLISFNRSKTWITPEFAAQVAAASRDEKFSEEQKAAWEKNPEEFLQYRKKIEGTMNQFFDMQYKDSEAQREAFTTNREQMEARLTKPGLAEKLIPDFALGCRRITPGHGYLEALSADNVEVRTDQILKIVPEGIQMQDGTIFTLDSIICATGFDTSFCPAFPVIGQQGKDLGDVWKDEPRSYLSVTASGFPNYFLASGPNFPLANGALVPCLEQCISYALAAAQKIQREGIKGLTPKPEAVDDFQEHKDALMKDLVWTSGCRSWYKNGKVDGKVWGPWCGSSIQFLELMSTPRWEDYDIEYLTGNRFQFLGAGKTEREESGGDLAYYLQQPGCT
ncbi:hypothetical protein QBC33DRAFT_582134 [Phialemonium atrogriseum]|uniref:Uncharacterized protein n=1 Tax=Phialemonium atrogriseum TaxID=1093897 RepID=A0AAJ0FH59_9PEZI|nr:uncharacterized protein QBC33DRAFT_582134 [Phialemonium atrogriseum]KAK1761804.1 hypothetical protein QBC33DRAFT_582134 [Phialemonium atrogriseum]